MHIAHNTHLPGRNRRSRGHLNPAARRSNRRTKPSRFDLSAIMLQGMADYRIAERKGWTTEGKSDSARWSTRLGWAWMLAKVAEEQGTTAAARLSSPRLP